MLIRLCASYCRVVHLLRAVPTLFASKGMAEFDRAVQKALAHGLGVLLPEQALLQLRLPMSLGGAGLRRSEEHSAGAYLASVMRAAEDDRWSARVATGFTHALEQLCDLSGLSAAAVCDPASVRTQRYFSAAVDKRGFSTLLAGASLCDKARLLSVCGK